MQQAARREASMNLDIRRPIGLLFAVLGALLLVYGLVSNAELYRRSFGINVNVVWGLVLLVFGCTMLWLGRKGLKAAPPHH
jgi:hypothetical protein